MVKNLIVLVVSTALGTLTGLGVGGGSLMMLWLTVCIQLPYPSARTLNLLYYFPAAIISCAACRKKHRLQLKELLPGILAGLVSGVLGTWMSRWLPVQILQKVLAAVFLAVGVREICYRDR